MYGFFDGTRGTRIFIKLVRRLRYFWNRNFLLHCWFVLFSVFFTNVPFVKSESITEDVLVYWDYSSTEPEYITKLYFTTGYEQFKWTPGNNYIEHFLNYNNHTRWETYTNVPIVFPQTNSSSVGGHWRCDTSAPPLNYLIVNWSNYLGNYKIKIRCHNNTQNSVSFGFSGSFATCPANQITTHTYNLPVDTESHQYTVYLDGDIYGTISIPAVKDENSVFIYEIYTSTQTDGIENEISPITDEITDAEIPLDDDVSESDEIIIEDTSKENDINNTSTTGTIPSPGENDFLNALNNSGFNPSSSIEGATVGDFNLIDYLTGYKNSINDSFSNLINFYTSVKNLIYKLQNIYLPSDISKNYVLDFITYRGKTYSIDLSRFSNLLDIFREIFFYFLYLIFFYQIFLMIKYLIGGSE